MPRQLRLLDQVLAQLNAARREACYTEARLQADAAGVPCLTVIVAAVRRLAQIPKLAYELRQLLAILRDMAITRADEAAGAGAPGRRLARARADIAEAAGDLDPVTAAWRLRRVWQWLDVPV
jgi:hypothetical protein